MIELGTTAVTGNDVLCDRLLASLSFAHGQCCLVQLISSICAQMRRQELPVCCLEEGRHERVRFCHPLLKVSLIHLD